MRTTLIFVVILLFALVGACDDGDSGPCGNGVLEEGEQCDGSNLDEATCATLGYHGGDLSCRSDCTYNLTSCEEYGRCGDGTVQMNGGEQCDGTNHDGKTCLNLGYLGGGELTCLESCVFDTSGCSTAECGNDIIEEDEECDRYNLAGLTCLDYGYYGGSVFCTDSCTIDSSDCTAYGFCGDGEKQTVFEECDGEDFLTTTCADFGYHTGTLVCNGDCTIDYSDCPAGGYCGDGTVQEGFESCDGTNLNSTTCVSLGYTDGGTLGCKSDCGFDKSNCAGSCGDGILQYPGEECEGTNHNGMDCESFGLQNGWLLCTSECEFDKSNCVAP